jgi:malate/lactate dehydrogenase
MAVISKGQYGAPLDVVFSFPVTCQNGDWTIVEDLKLSEFAKEKIAITGKELLEERSMALNLDGKK